MTLAAGPALTLKRYASLVRLSHTVFALPFAVAAFVLGSRYVQPTWRTFMLIVLCVASARTAAMAFNRLVDREYDAANPRTRTRELPQGLVSLWGVRALVLASCGVFVACCALLGRAPLMLSPVALALALGYSYVKRFSALSHLVLGLAIAFAPGGAWIALGAPLNAAPFLLVGAVACWVGGFDILYALQDREFDRSAGLHSIPARLGVARSLFVSRILHALTAGGLIAVGVVVHAGPWYFAGALLIAALLGYEHSLVRGDDLSKLDRAFFDINGYVSLAFMLATLLDRVL